MIYLTVEQVIAFHDEIIRETGGQMGIRDLGLLSSAVEMPRSTMFGQDLHPTVIQKGAAYLFHIAKNHAFLDGNKRTALASMLTFFDVNEVELNLDEDELEQITLHTADS